MASESAIGDPAAQTRAILEIIAKSLEDAGASLKDVIRTRIIPGATSPIGKRCGRVHGEFFGDIGQPSSMLRSLAASSDPDWLVEIEADAVISG